MVEIQGILVILCAGVNSRLSRLAPKGTTACGAAFIRSMVAVRLNAKDLFATDPRFSFALYHHAIDSAVKGYVKCVKGGLEDMPDYQRLCQQIELDKLESKKKFEELMDVVDTKPNVSRPISPASADPQLCDRRAAIISSDLGLWCIVKGSAQALARSPIIDDLNA